MLRTGYKSCVWLRAKTIKDCDDEKVICKRNILPVVGIPIKASDNKKLYKNLVE